MHLQAINVTLEIVCVLFSFALLAGLLITKAYTTKLARILFWMLTVNCATLLTDAVAWALAGHPATYMRPALMAANFLTYITNYAQLALTAYYITAYVAMQRPGAGKKFLKAFTAFVCGLIMLVVISQFNGMIYHINQENFFVTGPLYDVVMCCAVAFLLAMILFVLYYRKSFQGGDRTVIQLSLLFMLVAALGELLFSEIMLLNMMTAVSLTLLFVTIQFQQEKQAVERENEWKTAIMLSQIQPHFLHNSLLSIQYLCRRDPKAAEIAVKEFSQYLRVNMRSLTQKGPVSFEKELEHVCVYLSLEKKRFGKRLQVELDIQAGDFLLPVLTLQPIVENAVQHGVTKRVDGGKVRISTMEDKDCWRVVVEDNGVGFDETSSKKDDFAHMGLDNVRYRLEALCSGSLDIHSEIGEGTTAVIIVPKAVHKKIYKKV